MLNRIKRLGKIQKDTDSNFPLIKSLSYFIYSLYNSMGSEREGYYGDFIKGLGPPQMVGRQVLGLPCMGEIQLSIADPKGQIEVEVIRARGLIAKPGANSYPVCLIFTYIHSEYLDIRRSTTIALNTFLLL